MSKPDLFSVFAARYPAQPATAFWRAIEISALVYHGLPEQGLGLDLGCGDGILTDILLERVGSRRLVGIDLDPLETDAARHFSFYDRVHTCSAVDIPEPDSTFDFVLSNSVLEHIPPLEQTIAEVGRLLKPGGRFYFTVPGPGFHANLLGSLVPWHARDRYLKTLDARLAHFHYLSPADWAALVERYGMRVDKCLGYLNEAETRRWETLSRFTGGLLYALFGNSSRPIEIQRKLGVRSLQSRYQLPPFLAKPLGRLIRAGVNVSLDPPHWTKVEDASCLLVQGHRV